MYEGYSRNSPITPRFDIRIRIIVIEIKSSMVTASAVARYLYWY